MRVLIVDDHPVDRDLLASRLTALGHVVETADNGKRALDLALASPPDVIVSDILMPDMDGYALCRKVRSSRLLRQVPFVFFTSRWMDRADPGLGLTIGADRLIRKPMDGDRLMREIAAALEEKAPRRPARENAGTLTKGSYKKYDENLIRRMANRLDDLDKQTDLGLEETVSALRLSEKRFRMLAENARDVIYRMTLPEGRYEYMSPAAKEIFGHEPEAFYEHPLLIREIIHPDWRDVFAGAWQRLLNGLMPPVYEYAILHPIRGMRWLHQRNALIRDADGTPIAIEGVVTDMTDRKRLEEMERDLKRKAEAALRENEEKYHLIFEKVPVGISQFDADSVLIDSGRN